MAFCGSSLASNVVSPPLSNPFLQSRRTAKRSYIPSRPSSVRLNCSSCPKLKPLSIANGPENSKRKLSPVTKTLALAGSTALLCSMVLDPPPFLTNSNGSGHGGGFGGGGGGGNGGNGGGGNGGFWRRLCSLFSGSAAKAADEEESPSENWDTHGLPANILVPLSKLSDLKRYQVSDVVFFDVQAKEAMKLDNDHLLFEFLSLKPGGVYTKAHLKKQLETVLNSGAVKGANLEVMTNPEGTVGIKVAFRENAWRSPESIRCINVSLLPDPMPIEMDNDMTTREKLEYIKRQERMYNERVKKAKPCLLPLSVQQEISEMLGERREVSRSMLQRVQKQVEKWYHDQGYVLARLVNFQNLGKDELICEVDEGLISRLEVQFQDKLGNSIEGNTHLDMINRKLPYQLRPGHIYDHKDAYQALENLNQLGVFSYTQISPEIDEKNGGIIVQLNIGEHGRKSAEVTTEWSFVPGERGLPTLASLKPSGTVTVEHRNLNGLNRSISASLTTNDFLNPDDISFSFEYVHPYIDGVRNPRDRTLRTSCFNSHKMSPTFTAGPAEDRVPPLWIDRAGIKANITENFTPQSKITYGLVAEKITTRDEDNLICQNGQRLLPSGAVEVDGPPTTLSGTGVDHMVSAQANFTCDKTKFVNGATVGDRAIFQVDQGLFMGSQLPFFNRHQLTLTRFIQLKQVEEGAGNPPPPILVLHGHYGGCVGNLPSYDAFTLGGPYSVRGYNMGELGACRNLLEVAAELRIPVKNTHVYAFAEHGNDLGSSKDLKGNPTEYYRRAGQGSSYGVGVKLGTVRAEYAIDHNCGTGAVFLRFGERF